MLSRFPVFYFTIINTQITIHLIARLQEQVQMDISFVYNVPIDKVRKHLVTTYIEQLYTT